MNMRKFLKQSGEPGNFEFGIISDPLLINLFVGPSQIIEALRTNRMHVVHEELRGVPSGEYLRHRH